MYRRVGGASYKQNMENKQFQALMDEIKKSHCKVEGKLLLSISKLKQEVTSVKQEVTSVQVKTLRELAQKISKSNHQFKKKGNEIQYNFNLGIEESISSTKEDQATRERWK